MCIYIVHTYTSLQANKKIWIVHSIVKKGLLEFSARTQLKIEMPDIVIFLWISFKVEIYSRALKTYTITEV